MYLWFSCSSVSLYTLPYINMCPTVSTNVTLVHVVTIYSNFQIQISNAHCGSLPSSTCVVNSVHENFELMASTYKLRTDYYLIHDITGQSEIIWWRTSDVRGMKRFTSQQVTSTRRPSTIRWTQTHGRQWRTRRHNAPKTFAVTTLYANYLATQWDMSRPIKYGAGSYTVLERFIMNIWTVELHKLLYLA
jgi:hypothetical protein